MAWRLHHCLPRAIKRPGIVRTFTYSPSSLSPPRKFAVVGQSAPNESVESLHQLGPRKLTHRQCCSIQVDAPTWTSDPLPKDLLYRREGSRVLESLPLLTSSWTVKTALRTGTVCTSIPRRSSASSGPPADAAAGSVSPFGVGQSCCLQILANKQDCLWLVPVWVW